MLPATRPPTRAPRRATTGPPAAVRAPVAEPLDTTGASSQKKKGGRSKGALVALALVLVLAAVAVAILVSQTSGAGFTDINAGSARDQANDLIRYIRDHKR